MTKLTAIEIRANNAKRMTHYKGFQICTNDKGNVWILPAISISDNSYKSVRAAKMFITKFGK